MTEPTREALVKRLRELQHHAEIGSYLHDWPDDTQSVLRRAADALASPQVTEADVDDLRKTSTGWLACAVCRRSRVTEAMVERAAKAIWQGTFANHHARAAPWDTLPESDREYYRTIARDVFTTEGK